MVNYFYILVFYALGMELSLWLSAILLVMLGLDDNAFPFSFVKEPKRKGDCSFFILFPS